MKTTFVRLKVNRKTEDGVWAGVKKAFFVFIRHSGGSW